jgi:hypothetical protein
MAWDGIGRLAYLELNFACCYMGRTAMRKKTLMYHKMELFIFREPAAFDLL